MKQQLQLLKKEKSDFGGELMKKRKNRLGHRQLATRSSMHLVLRSTLAKGQYSFSRPQNRQMVQDEVYKFAKRNHVKILSLAIVGNHIHFHLQLGVLRLYKSFIRGLTASLALKISGASKNRSLKDIFDRKFWDYRPFTRVVSSFRAWLNLRDYVRINQWEGYGCDRIKAAFLIKRGVFCNSP